MCTKTPDVVVNESLHISQEIALTGYILNELVSSKFLTFMVIALKTVIHTELSRVFFIFKQNKELHLISSSAKPVKSSGNLGLCDRWLYAHRVTIDVNKKSGHDLLAIFWQNTKRSNKQTTTTATVLSRMYTKDRHNKYTNRTYNDWVQERN